MANETNNKNFRIESDLLGELQVPANAYYGVQTQRAVNNYHISGKRMCDYPDYVIAMAYVKLAAVETNRELGEINNEICDAMAQACREIIDGKFHEDFVVCFVCHFYMQLLLIECYVYVSSERIFEKSLNTL